MVASGEVLGPFLSTSRRSPDVSRIGFYSDPYSLRRVTTKTILFAELLPEEQNCLDPIFIRLNARGCATHLCLHLFHSFPPAMPAISIDELLPLNSLEVFIGREADGADTLHAR